MKNKNKKKLVGLVMATVLFGVIFTPTSVCAFGNGIFSIFDDLLEVRPDIGASLDETYVFLEGGEDDLLPSKMLFNVLVGPAGEPGGAFVLYDHDAGDGILYNEIVYGTYGCDPEDLLYFAITIEESTIIDQYMLQFIIDEMENPEMKAQAQADYNAMLAAGQTPELEIVLYSSTDGYYGGYVQFVATSMGYVLLDSTRHGVPFIHEVGDEAENYYNLYIEFVIPEEYVFFEEGIYQIKAIHAIEEHLIPLGAQQQVGQCPNPAYQDCIDDCHDTWDPIIEQKMQVVQQKQEEERRAKSNLVSKLKIFRNKAASSILRLIIGGLTLGLSELLQWILDNDLFEMDAELEAAKQDVLNAKWAWDDAKAALQAAWDDYGNAIEARLNCLQDCEQIPKTIPCEPTSQPASQPTSQQSSQQSQ